MFHRTELPQGPRVISARLSLSGFRVIDLGAVTSLAHFVEGVAAYPASLLAVYPVFALDSYLTADIRAGRDGESVAEQIPVLFEKGERNGERGGRSGLICHVCDLARAVHLVEELSEAS